VSGGLTFTSLAAGNAHTCGLVANGTLYCWGHNFSGELGLGHNTDRLVPGAITGRTFARVAAGGSQTFALVGVPGAAYCWGANTYGQIGDNTLTSRDTPTLVSGGRTYQGITAGFFHTCAWTALSQAYCWGSGTEGQIGNGRVDEMTRVPAAVAGGFRFTLWLPGT